MGGTLRCIKPELRRTRRGSSGTRGSAHPLEFPAGPSPESNTSTILQAFKSIAPENQQQWASRPRPDFVYLTLDSRFVMVAR